MTDNVKPIKTTRNLKQHKRNANKGTARGRSVLKQSLAEVGAWRSIGVDKHGNIGVGNATGDTWRRLWRLLSVVFCLVGACWMPESLTTGGQQSLSV